MYFCLKIFALKYCIVYTSVIDHIITSLKKLILPHVLPLKKFKTLFVICIWFYVCCLRVYIYSTLLPGAHLGQRGYWISWKLLWTTMWVLGTVQTIVLGKNSQSQHCWATSLAPSFLVLHYHTIPKIYFFLIRFLLSLLLHIWSKIVIFVVYLSHWFFYYIFPLFKKSKSLKFLSRKGYFIIYF